MSMFSPVVASNAGIPDRFQVLLPNLPADEDGRCSLLHTSSTETTVAAVVGGDAREDTILKSRCCRRPLFRVDNDSTTDVCSSAPVRAIEQT